MRRLSIVSIGSMFALAVGCSDDPAPSDASTADVATLDTGSDLGSADAGTPDVPVATDVVDASAPVDASDGGGPACALTRALVTTSDYVTGGYGLGPIGPTPALTVTGAMSPDQDHVPVTSGCVVYDLLRGEDVIAVLDPAMLPSIARRIPLRMMGTPGLDAGAPMPYSANPYDVLTVLSLIHISEPTRPY